MVIIELKKKSMPYAWSSNGTVHNLINMLVGTKYQYIHITGLLQDRWQHVLHMFQNI